MRALRGTLIAACFAAVAFGAAKRLEAGERAPDLTLRTLADKELRYDAPDGEGATASVAVIAFLDPDQEASRRLLSDLGAVHEALPSGAPPVHWYCVVSGKLSEAEIAAAQAAEKARPFLQIGVDPGRTSYAEFGVVALPTTFVVGTDGIVRSALPGHSSRTRRDLKTALLGALGLDVPKPDAEMSPEHKRALRLLAAARDLRRRDRVAEAAERLRDATKISEDAIEVWVALGDALLVLEEGGEALAAFDRALTLDKKSRAATVGRACALAYGDDADAAETALRLALRRPPQDPRLYYHLGRVLESRGDAAGATAAYRRAAEKLLGR